MPLGGGGVWERTPGTRITNQGALVSAQVNDETDNLLAGINVKASLSGVLGMTGLQLLFGDGTAALHGATVQQAQKQILSHSTAVAGTVDAIQITMAPVSTTWTLNETVKWKSGGANTITAPTISKDGGSTSKIIKKGASAALAVGDLGASGYECEGIYNGTDVILQNPVAASVAVASETVSGTVELATDAETQTGTDTARAITPANLTAKEATVANFRANTADRILTTDIVFSAAAEVTLTDAATIAVDMATFFNAIVTLGGNRTLGQPSNTKVGQSGAIRIVQDGTGSRTLAYHADYKFAGGTDPTLTTTAAATDLLLYQIIATNFIYATLVKGVA